MRRRGPVLRIGLALGAAALALTACSARVGVHISGDLDRPVARFGSDPDRPEKACLRSLSVHHATSAGQTAGRPPLWAIEARGGRCIGLRQVVYGEAPKGFDTLAPAAALQPDTAYSVIGRGVTGGPLSRVPWLGGAEIVFAAGRWRALAAQARAPDMDAEVETAH